MAIYRDFAVFVILAELQGWIFYEHLKELQRELKISFEKKVYDVATYTRYEPSQPSISQLDHRPWMSSNKYFSIVSNFLFSMYQLMNLVCR